MLSWLKDMLDRLKLAALFDSQDPSREVNLVAYAYGVIVMSVWLSFWLGAGNRDGNFVTALGIFAGAITGGLFKRGSVAPDAPKRDTPPKEDEP